MAGTVDRLAESVFSGKLDLLCRSMELRQYPECSEVLLSGCGTIFTDSRGKLRFRMSFDLPYPIPPVLLKKRPKGEILEESDYVQLVALDEQRNEWESEPIHVNLSHPGEFMYGYLSKPMSFATRSRRWGPEDKHTMCMYIPNQDSILFDQVTHSTTTVKDEVVSGGYALDHHVRMIDGVEVTFRRLEGSWLKVSATQSAPFSAHWYCQMLDAIAFVTARVVRPVMVVRTDLGAERCGIFSGPFRSERSYLPPPIAGSSEEVVRTFWSLVEKVFLFAQKRPRDDQVLEELSVMRKTSVMSEPTHFLALGVTVEVLARELLPVPPVRDWNAQSLAQLLEHISSWQGDEDTQRRALGLLRAKAEVRAVDRLYAWASHAGVPKELVDAWKRLRNSAAHGGRLDFEQSDWNTYYAVVELLYRIVAWAAGYTGPVIQLSTPGWKLPLDSQDA